MLLEIKRDWIPKIERYIISHEWTELPITVIEDLIECCNMVLEGKASKEAFQNDHSFWAVSKEEQRTKRDEKKGNLIYDSLKI